MKFVKSVLLGLPLALSLSLNVYAADKVAPATSAEKTTLATIAAIDKNEILVSSIAQNKQVDSGVIDFAKMMISQHGDNLTQILEMENQLKTGALSGNEAETISNEGKQDLIKLGALQGNDFAKAYVNAMVKGHEAALTLINTKLMKTATTPEIKKFLTDTRTAVEQHLEHAKQLQQQLNS